MKTRTHYSAFLAAGWLLALLLIAGCTGKEPTHDDETHAAETTFAPVSDTTSGTSVQRYTCSMHPQVISDEPGYCPICHMTLTPIKQSTSSEGVIAIDPVTIQNIGVRTAPVQIRSLSKTIRTTGRFEMDEQGAYQVTLKVGGWVEKLYADYEGLLIQKGKPLLELYSPELVSTQEDYLIALRNARRYTAGTAAEDAKRLLDAARRRLAYWDLTEKQIQTLEETGQPLRTLTFFAPASGEVMNKAVVAGQRIEAGQTLMEIIDLTRIWLMTDIYEQDLGWIEKGTSANIELPYQPGVTLQGKVDHIYLMLNAETRSARARIVLPGKGANQLKPGMYATVLLAGKSTAPKPVVPEETLIHTGEQTVVILALGGGRFRPQEVRTGIEADGMVQVLDGLHGGEHVVTSAQFLIDSESRLKGAVEAMGAVHQHGGTEMAQANIQDTHQHEHEVIPETPRTSTEETSLLAMRVDVSRADQDGDGKVYLCTDQPHLLQDKPGPIADCKDAVEPFSIGAAQYILHASGYTNIPVYPSDSDLDGDGFIYQSTMHVSVLKDTPGSCDVCSMTLERRSIQEVKAVLKKQGYLVQE